MAIMAAMIYVPNILTVFRMVLVPFLVILLFNQQYVLALAVFLLAGITDALDGLIAHRFNCVTKLGERLDPIADKSLLVTVFIMLTYLGYIPFWLTVIVVFRDILIIGGAIYLMLVFGNLEINPLIVSKINTFLQIAFLLIVLLFLAKPAIKQPWLMEGSYILIAIMSVLSGGAYIWQGVRLAMRGELK